MWMVPLSRVFHGGLELRSADDAIRRWYPPDILLFPVSDRKEDQLCMCNTILLA